MWKHSNALKFDVKVANVKWIAIFNNFVVGIGTNLTINMRELI
jgi:hypothetical protein